MGKRRPVMWQLPMRSPLYFKLGSNLPLLIRRKEGFEVVPVGIPHCIFLFGSRACEDHHEIKAKGQQRETTGSHCKATCLIFPWKRFFKKNSVTVSAETLKSVLWSTSFWCISEHKAHEQLPKIMQDLLSFTDTCLYCSSFSTKFPPRGHFSDHGMAAVCWGMKGVSTLAGPGLSVAFSVENTQPCPLTIQLQSVPIRQIYCIRYTYWNLLFASLVFVWMPARCGRWIRCVHALQSEQRRDMGPSVMSQVNLRMISK